MEASKLYVYRALVVRVVDGDTVDVNIDCGFRVFITVRVRLDTYNAPEPKEPNGPEAKAWLESLLPVGTACVLQTKKTERWNRWLGKIWLQDGASINELGSQQSWSTPYRG